MIRSFPVATIGHTLVGMTLATVPLRPPRPGWVAWWPGLLVLGTHFLDVGEWLSALGWHQVGAWHSLHTWPAAFGCAAGGALLLWLVFRVRRLGPHLLLAFAILSHMPMDGAWLNAQIRLWYREPPPGTPIEARELNLPAEVWWYGYALLAGLLLNVAARTDRGMGVRRAAVLLLPATLSVFFAPMARLLWITTYVLVGLFVLWALRPRPRLAWGLNALLVVPVLALAGTEAVKLYEVRQAAALERSGSHEHALIWLRRALELPTRTDSVGLWWRIGIIEERQGRLREAEAALTKCVENDTDWHWSQLELAGFYLRHPGTPHHRPETAGALIRSVLNGDHPEFAKQSARNALARLQSNPPPRPSGG